MRLINADALKEVLINEYEAREHYIGEIMLKVIDNAPTISVDNYSMCYQEGFRDGYSQCIADIEERKENNRLFQKGGKEERPQCDDNCDICVNHIINNNILILGQITKQIKLIMLDIDEYSYTDLINIIASLHNEYFRTIAGEYYDYMFHWYNKSTGGLCEDDLFKHIRKEIENP